MGKLKFEYCECGCKCYTAYKRGIFYSIFWDLEKDRFYLTFDRWTELGKYKSYKKAQKAANKHYKRIK